MICGVAYTDRSLPNQTVEYDPCPSFPTILNEHVVLCCWRRSGPLSISLWTMGHSPPSSYALSDSQLIPLPPFGNHPDPGSSRLLLTGYWFMSGWNTGEIRDLLIWIYIPALRRSLLLDCFDTMVYQISQVSTPYILRYNNIMEDKEVNPCFCRARTKLANFQGGPCSVVARPIVWNVEWY